MAGPEPYPQEKWTIEQEKAYAEGRESAKGSSGKGSASRSGSKRSGRKRYVRTAAGEKRYKVPIGSEIGSARNASAAEAQKDTESTGRYNELVGADRDAQARAMGGLSNDQLQRLSRVAYSFRSIDPNVVRLRIGVANELRRRGMDVNDFGGLGRGGGSGVAQSKRKSKATPSAGSTSGVQAAMARMYGRKELSVPQLRKLVGVFSRVAPDKREKVARFLVGRAIELSAPHLLGQSVIEAANLPDEQTARVLELAGKWRHGWVPLDAVAMRAKMKGGNGKPWWSGGKMKRRGSAASHRKSVEAGRTARTNKQVAEHNKVAVSKIGDRQDFLKSRKEMPAAKRPLGFTTIKLDGSETFTDTSGTKERTTVVRSGSPTKGTKMDQTQRADKLKALEAEYDRWYRKKTGSLVVRNNRLGQLRAQIDKLKGGS